MIADVKKCTECGNEFVVAEYRNGKPVCLSCKMWEDTQKDKPSVEKTKPKKK